MTGVPEHDFEHRVDDWRDDAVAALSGLYGDRAHELWDDVVRRARAVDSRRPPDLAALDRHRREHPDWFLAGDRVGYIAYADRFGGTLAGVGDRLDYLQELGINVVHLMSVLKARAGESDGGYAIADYGVPEPALGTSEDLDDLARRMRDHGMSLCLDFVMNHTSDDHEWARLARRGSRYHLGLYRTFADRTVPDRFERTLPEVFPNLAPGNFTWNAELRRWVWTTFREFQWDLDWANPDVMLEMVDALFHLADVGMEIVRLDAVAFTWKRQGTNCQNQPEAHLIAQALRAALAVAAPATAMLAEAIVGPDELVGYLGRHELERRECDLAYHNQLMVQGWSMLATGRADLATGALRRLPDPPERTTWFTYVRCHDDIGWAVSDEDAADVGLTGFDHRQFLARFYRGDFWESFARGVAFGSNSATGDERTCGTTAALCGITAAASAGTSKRGDLDRALARHRLLYALAFGFGGLPMIYMGDELGQSDDRTYLDDPARAADARWTHRPPFDEQLARSRHDPGSVSGRAWRNICTLVEARQSCPPLGGPGRTEVIDTGAETLLVWRRTSNRRGTVVGVANAGSHTARLQDWVLGLAASPPAPVVDVLAPSEVDLASVAPLQVRWLTGDLLYRTLPPPGP